MKKNFFLTKLLILHLFFASASFADNLNYHSKAKEFFDNNQFDKAKFLFEKDIVFNPKNENSYLYLAKIFNNSDNEERQELNLNSTLILNPKNEEAIYMLIMLKIKQYDYDQAKELTSQFNLVCKSFCSKKKSIEDKLKKLNPEDAKKQN
jgi:tetratricopeptide (TPR) repeat protein